MVLAFLLLIGIVSALLPVDYSVGILDALFTAVRWALFLVAQVAFFLLFVLSYLIGLIFSLFSGKPVASTEPMRQAVPPPPPPTLAHEAAPWWQLVRSLVFWTILMGIMGYSVYHFAVDRWAIFRMLSLGRLLSGLRQFLRNLKRQTDRATAFLRREIGLRLATSRRPKSSQRWRYVSLRRLQPRDRVRYFYLSTLRRTAQQGLSRAPSATPLEYKPVLARELPAAADEVGALTDAFIEARYSEHRLDTDDASVAQRVWRHVRRALTRRKRRRARARSDSS